MWILFRHGTLPGPKNAFKFSLISYTCYNQLVRIPIIRNIIDGIMILSVVLPDIVNTHPFIMEWISMNLGPLLPSFASLNNPVDITDQTPPERYIKCLQKVMDEPSVNTHLFIDTRYVYRSFKPMFI